MNDEIRKLRQRIFLTAKGGIFLRKNILAICDEEQDYASHFLDYLSRNGERENFPFEVRVFTERESWEHFLKQNSASVLLVSQPFYERYAEGWEAGQVIVLAAVSYTHLDVYKRQLCSGI